MSVDLRGIEVTFNVTVHNVVKGIIASTGDDTRMAVGDEIMVSAIAYDAKQDDKKSGAEGIPVPNITFTWMSSDEDVATVDEDGVVTATGVGDADITAHVADVMSNKIGVTVFAVQSIARRLDPTLPIAGTFVEADVDSTLDAGSDPPTYTVVSASAVTPNTLAINVTLEQYDANAESWGAVDDNAGMVKFVSLNTDVLTFTDATASATDADYMGMATLPTSGGTGGVSVSLAADNSARGKVVGRGTARVEISSKYADTIYIEVDITLPTGAKAGS